MIDQPLVSIIIPTLNSESTLAKCLESIRNQTYKNIEVILVDKFSDDRTIEIASKYRIKIFQIQANERCEQLNFGAKNSDGKYIYRVDSDFILDPDVVKQAINKCVKEDYDAICVHNTSDPTISFWSKVRKLERDCYFHDELNVATRFIRKDVFEAVGGFDEEMVAAEDYDLHNRILNNGYKIGKIESIEVHIGELKTLGEIVRREYYMGKTIHKFIEKNKGKAIRQLSPIRPAFIRHWRKFASQPILTLGFIIYQFIRYISSGLGYLATRARDLYLSLFLIVSSSLLLTSYVYFFGINAKIVTCLMSILIGSIIYLFMRERKHAIKQLPIKYVKTFRLLLNIAFTILMTISFLLLIKDLYIRPLSYFISISILSVLIFLETEVSNYKLILPKILLLSANLRIGLLYKFPSITGGDGAYHYGLTKATLITGDIVGKTEFFYSEYPIPHINTLVHMLVAGVNYKDALTTSWAVPLSLISVFFVFLIGRELFNEKIGLISSLLITLFPFEIWHSYQLAPMTFATALIPLMIYLFVIRKSKNHFRLGIVTLIIIAYSHPLVMVEILIIGFGLFIGSLVSRINDKNSRIFPYAHILIIFFTRWIYFSRSFWIRRIVNSISDLYYLAILIMNVPSSGLALEYVAGNLSIFDEMLNTLGFSIFLCMSVIGILFIISSKSMVSCGSLNQFRTQKIEILFATILFAVIVFGFSSIGVGVIPYRWFGPMGTLLAIPAAIGIQKGLVKKSVSATIMFILIFFMITNSVANIDSPIYANEDTIRWSYTESEMSAADWSFQKSNGILFDGSYVAYLRSLKFRYDPSKTSSDDCVILIRNYILEHAFYNGDISKIISNYGKGERKISRVRISMLNDQEKKIILNLDKILSKVYENGKVKAYYQNPLQ